jgi:hypothetical protein
MSINKPLPPADGGQKKTNLARPEKLSVEALEARGFIVLKSSGKGYGFLGYQRPSPAPVNKPDDEGARHEHPAR